jgi:hypothetical protein
MKCNNALLCIPWFPDLGRLQSVELRLISDHSAVSSQYSLAKLKDHEGFRRDVECALEAVGDGWLEAKSGIVGSIIFELITLPLRSTKMRE